MVVGAQRLARRCAAADLAAALRGGSAEAVVVLDKPWLLGVLTDDRVIAAGEDLTLADPLGELLDLPLASVEIEATVASGGEAVAWEELGAVVAACDLLDLDLPP